jgi:hypothetical protein
MPRVIDYQIVQERMKEAGYLSLYHNSGAFGFASSEGVRMFGQIGPDDPTIRDSVCQFIQQVPPPYVSNLVERLGRDCEKLATTVWLMPKSHWYYELHFGNRESLESLLPRLGIDAAMLRERNDGSAIAFLSSEFDLLKLAVRELLERLKGSDFALVFLDAATLCTIHHHKQLWWQTKNPIVTQPTAESST